MEFQFPLAALANLLLSVRAVKFVGIRIFDNSDKVVNVFTFCWRNSTILCVIRVFILSVCVCLDTPLLLSLGVRIPIMKCQKVCMYVLLVLLPNVVFTYFFEMPLECLILSMHSLCLSSKH